MLASLKPELACDFFASADRFHMEDLRATARDLIFMNPAEALKERLALRPELLEEILGSGLLCIEAEDMKTILQGWGGDDCDSLASMMNVRAGNEHTEDVLGTLWSRYESGNKKGVFLAYWVSVVLGPGLGGNIITDELEPLASNQARYYFADGWVQWHLPHASVHLQGVSFKVTTAASTSFRINVKSDEDGATWHLAYESHRKEIQKHTFLACKRPLGLVKYFKLEVLEGELGTDFNIHGILQTSIAM
ncbi:bath-40 [Symbiodinium sp. CCMP2592]|nr:bath-40 [Symbiodinium sp. CCMP2592]